MKLAREEFHPVMNTLNTYVYGVPVEVLEIDDVEVHQRRKLELFHLIGHYPCGQLLSPHLND